MLPWRTRRYCASCMGEVMPNQSLNRTSDGMPPTGLISFRPFGIPLSKAGWRERDGQTRRSLWTGARQAQRSTRHTARASIDSPRPTGPMPSAVLALMLI